MVLCNLLVATFYFLRQIYSLLQGKHRLLTGTLGFIPVRAETSPIRNALNFVCVGQLKRISGRASHSHSAQDKLPILDSQQCPD